jgi:hypothetical protein
VKQRRGQRHVHCDRSSEEDAMTTTRSPTTTLALIALTLAACAPAAPAEEGTGNQGAGDGGDAPSTGATSGGGAAGGEGISVGSGPGGGAGAEQIAEVFGESADVLYRLDPTTKEVTVVGPFQGCGEVKDIAIDRDSNIWGTTDDALYRIDRTTAACTLVAHGSFPNSLSFVPAGTLDANVEALVGYVESDYVRIDTATGDVWKVGALGPGLESSGDIVSVEGGKTLLTIAGQEGSNDWLVEVDPVSGTTLWEQGELPYSEVFGLAFWAGRAYGFSAGGDLFEVTLDAGGATTTPIAIPNPPPGLAFWGAGSTTIAPPEEVPN